MNMFHCVYAGQVHLQCRHKTMRVQVKATCSVNGTPCVCSQAHLQCQNKIVSMQVKSSRNVNRQLCVCRSSPPAVSKESCAYAGQAHQQCQKKTVHMQVKPTSSVKRPLPACRSSPSPVSRPLPVCTSSPPPVSKENCAFAGQVHLQCQKKAATTRLVVTIVVSVLGSLLLLALALLVAAKGKSLLEDFNTARLHRIKRRWACSPALPPL